MNRGNFDYDEDTGRTAAVEEVEVRTRVRGYLVRVNFKEGVEVKTDDLLFQEESTVYGKNLYNL